MKKHCGNCANHREETNQFSEECGKCVSARLENGEITAPSHWREKPQTNADRIRAMSDEEMATDLIDMFQEICEDGVPSKEWMLEWLKQTAEEE